MKNLHEELSKPFPNKEIDFRIMNCGVNQRSGVPWAQVVPFIDARCVMERLDSVCGPGGWQVTYQHLPNIGFLCSLSLKIENEWITKQDASEFTDIEPCKGGISGSLKRAAVAWGIGRYLYETGTMWAKIVSQDAPGARYAKAKDGTVFHWLPPESSQSAPVASKAPSRTQGSTGTAKPTPGAAPAKPMGSDFAARDEFEEFRG